MLGFHGHEAVRFFQRATPTVISVNNGHLRGAVTLTRIPECLSEELSLPVFYSLVLPRLGFENPIFCWRGARMDFVEKLPCEAHHGILKISQLITIFLLVAATLWLNNCYGVNPIKSINFVLRKRTVTQGFHL